MAQDNAFNVKIVTKVREEEMPKDEYKKVQIPFGFNEKAERILLPLFHSFFVAMTGHGKTLGMKSLLYRFHELHPDWKVLVIDSKDKRDYADLSADIPICFVETTDPLDLKALLEPIVGSNLMYYFDKMIEEAVFDTLGEIQRSINQKVEDADAGRIKIHGKDLGKLRVLNYTMRKLVTLVEKPNIVKELKLREGFNVMPVSLPDVKNPNLKRAFQQLIVRSVLVLLLSDQSLEKTLLVLDECHKWSPQRYGSICKQPLSEFVSEGRSQDKFLWESDQALTKVDKEPLKNIKIWIIGQQMESNEVEDAKNTVNDITDLGISDSDIKTLKIGNFILVDGLHGKVEKVYLQPYGVPDKLALQIAEGADPELAESYIVEFESKSQKGDDLVYKEKYEEEKRLREEERKKREEVEKEFARQLERLSNEKARAMEHARELEKRLEPFEKFTDALGEIMPSLNKNGVGVPTPNGMSSEVAVSVQPTLTEFTVKAARREVLEASDKDTDGQILLMVSRGFFDQPRKTSHVCVELERVWNSRPRPRTPETILANLTEKGILTREKEANSWSYSIAAKAKELIHVVPEKA